MNKKSQAQVKPSRKPTSPAIFLQDILEEYRLTQEKLAENLGVSRRTVNQLLNGHRSITANVAVRLARLTNTTPYFWLNMQNRLDIWEAERSIGTEIERIESLPLRYDNEQDLQTLDLN